MTDPAGLERQYRRLLACYSRSFRRDNEDEILAVLIAGDVAPAVVDGQRVPAVGELDQVVDRSGYADMDVGLCPVGLLPLC